MPLKLGDSAPNFQIETQHGQIDFHNFIGNSWVFFFSHPTTCVPISATEMKKTAQLTAQFEQRNLKPMGLASTYLQENHLLCQADEKTDGQFPIILDADERIANLYQIKKYSPQTQMLRTIFIIAPDKKIKMMMNYPMSIDKTFSEFFIFIDAIQATCKLDYNLTLENELLSKNNCANNQLPLCHLK